MDEDDEEDFYQTRDPGWIEHGWLFFSDAVERLVRGGETEPPPPLFFLCFLPRWR